MQWLLNTEWLQAKGDMDSQCASASEMEKRRFLCEILMVSVIKIKLYFKLKTMSNELLNYK